MTARERVRTALDNVQRHDPTLRALITLRQDEALSDAERLDAEDGTHGPLHGIPFALKDNIDLAGVASTAGSTFCAQPASEDATTTRLLRTAGAVFVAKANMAEWALGITTRNRIFGDCRNPWDPERIPGGSSGGSAAAVASGMCAIALGTDTGGSVRVPASACGVAGLRPTQGRVSNRGVRQVAESFDTVGPIAGDVRLLGDTLAALDRFDERDPTSVRGQRTDVRALISESPSGLRLGVPENFFFDGIDRGVRRIVLAAIDDLTRLGARPTPVRIPRADEAQRHMLHILYPEAAAFHATRLATQREDFDPDVLRRLRLGEGTSAARTRQARHWRTEFQREVDEVFHHVDLVVSPSIPIDVPRHTDVDLAASTEKIGRFTYAWSMYGGPSISVPCGVHPGSGMPVGLQLSAAPWCEHLLLQAATHYDDATRQPSAHGH